MAGSADRENCPEGRTPIPGARTARTAILLLVAGCVSAEGMSRGAPAPATPAPVTGHHTTLTRQVALSTFDSAWSVVQHSYMDTAFIAAHWNSVRDSLRPRAAAARSGSALRRVLTEMVANIPDSHFYIIPEGASSATHGSHHQASDAVTPGNAGLALRLVAGKVVVWRVRPGGAAERAGVRPGAVVQSLADRPIGPALARIALLDTPALVRRARTELLLALNNALEGPARTNLHIRLRDLADGMVRDLAIQRAPDAHQLTRFGDLPPLDATVRTTRLRISRDATPGDSLSIAVIAFNLWLPAIAPALDSAIAAAHDCDGIVLDLRGNPGGVVGMVSGVGGYFLDSVVSLGTVRTRTGSLRFTVNPRLVTVAGLPTTPYAGPLVILTDALTASTSEIFAAGLQQLGRARIIGQRSAGMALPAFMDRLPSGDVFVHAIADFTAPDGQRIEGVGITPDERVPLTRRDVTDGRDAPLLAAERWIGSATKHDVATTAGVAIPRPH